VLGRGIAAGLLCTLAVAIPATGTATGASLAASWCGSLNDLDRLCPKFGRVAVSTEVLPLGGVHRIEGGSTVSSDPGSEARLSFARQAICELGPDAAQILTRPGDSSSLFLQTLGRSRCRSNRAGATWVSLRCLPDGRCPAQADVRGKFVVFREQQAQSSAVEGEVRSAVMVICAGFYNVRIESDFGFAEVGGGSSSRGPVLIRIVESDHELDLKAERVQGRACTGLARRF